ncbi:helix-turn-helix domain-containing protein [Streptomyces ziwulingensis]|uniref:HTH cro/C1-type domain-containing protein n=1 Tax=Streptomyces ziwulingensis TaxID=1045501 RepID=A0ABP9BDT3_9ACTN
MNEDIPTFGSVLRDMRLAASLTIEGLSERSGVSVRAIGDLERGRRAAPQRRTVTALARGLGLTEPDRERLLGAVRAGRDRTPAHSPLGIRALPSGIPDFTGRERELSWLTAAAEQAVRALTAPGGARSRPAFGTYPVVAAVSGPPGTGKTALALHAARSLAHHFPDGQLLVDLRGLDRDAPGPDEIMLGVLRALRVADRELAEAGPRGRLELYRQVLADRRLLLVLDNARDETQVRPLLPGAGAGLVVVTSRRMLTGLESVRRLALGDLDPRAATAFLTALVGEERAAADPGALARVARYCGHLPLALRAAGDWLAARTGVSVDRFADRLAPDEGRLAALAAGGTDLTAAFGLSYRRLTPAGARLFRRLALVPDPDITAAGAAQLSGQHLFAVEDTLEELVEAGLLGVEGDRYRLHDLLRLYARTRLTAEEEPADIDRAQAALYGWLHRPPPAAGRWFCTLSACFLPGGRGDELLGW